VVAEPGGAALGSLRCATFVATQPPYGGEHALDCPTSSRRCARPVGRRPPGQHRALGPAELRAHGRQRQQHEQRLVVRLQPRAALSRRQCDYGAGGDEVPGPSTRLQK
jgi:hypothetical protein